ncbi:MAG: alpha/beta hydrolase [Betaproteobacteria bacterium]|jgi:pimeloyl-ACP methyl ester carboxylesterase|nr:alpha/beta hydrolase [Betaproteobacteria bacterium]
MPQTPAATTTQFPIQAQDWHGLTRLGFDAALGITHLVENMHETISARAGVLGAQRTQPTRGITGLVYRAVRGGTRVAGQGVGALTGLLARLPNTRTSTPERETMLAVLNGVFGDHLAETGNPLAINMRFRINGQALDLNQAAMSQQIENPSGKLLVLVHGLCMNDLQWSRQGHDHGKALCKDLGYTPVYLNYNTGKHVSENGRDFCAALDQLIAVWPVALQELVIVGHSMGGLVTRSACHVATEQQSPWLALLRKVIFLGTPHHGAPMERGGQMFDSLLGQSPYLAPFTRLGKARSSGITDLRFGNLQDADWQGRDRHAQKKDDRTPTPLPEGVDTYLIAAVKASKLNDPRNAVIGDGLVPLASALGKHRQPELALSIPATHQWVATEANHWDLLSRQDVYQHLRAWLADDQS